MAAGQERVESLHFSLVHFYFLAGFPDASSLEPFPPNQQIGKLHLHLQYSIEIHRPWKVANTLFRWRRDISTIGWPQPAHRVGQLGQSENK